MHLLLLCCAPTVIPIALCSCSTVFWTPLLDWTCLTEQSETSRKQHSLQMDKASLGAVGLHTGVVSETGRKQHSLQMDKASLGAVGLHTGVFSETGRKQHTADRHSQSCGQWAYTLAWSNCVELCKQQPRRSQWLRCKYLSSILAERSGDSWCLTLLLWSPGCCDHPAVYLQRVPTGKKHQLSLPFSHLLYCEFASVDDMWQNDAKTAFSMPSKSSG